MYSVDSQGSITSNTVFGGNDGTVNIDVIQKTDVAGNVTEVNDKGNITKYEYDL